jgi:hypothetical protein
MRGNFMTQVVGFAEKQGTYENIVYDNIVLYLLSDDDPDINGFSASEIKIKRSDLPRILDKLSPRDLLNREIELFYSLINGKPKLRRITLSDSVVIG